MRFEHLFVNIAFIVVPICLTCGECSCLPANYAPVVGVMAEDCYSESDLSFGKSFVDASYVKWAEGGGMRVVPVFLNRSEQYYRSVYKRLNGLILPGGGVILGSGDYYNNTKLLLKWAQNDYLSGKSTFPIFGICMGFEVLVYLLNNERDFRSQTAGTYNVSMPLILTPDAYKSNLFSGASDWLFDRLSNEPITANFHHFSLTYETYNLNEELKKNLKVLSTNFDSTGEEFVSTVEHRELPVFAIQWHPEKNAFVYNYASISHSPDAIQVMQFMAGKLSQQSRLSCHVYPEDELKRDLIWNYRLAYFPDSYKSKFYFDW